MNECMYMCDSECARAHICILIEFFNDTLNPFEMRRVVG